MVAITVIVFFLALVYFDGKSQINDLGGGIYKKQDCSSEICTPFPDNHSSYMDV